MANLTVKELKEGLQDIDDNFTVHAYEGEGGCWIMVKSLKDVYPLNDVVKEFHTEPI